VPPNPLYTPENCEPAYQLRWSLALFANAKLPPSDTWLDALKLAVEADGVRILEYRPHEPPTHRFLLSTCPEVVPPQIVKSVKGRLQSQVRTSLPKAFRRNFDLTSVGEADRETIERYVGDQLGHHRMADDRVQERLKKLHIEFAEVDLSRPVYSAHGRYLYNLHVALVHEGRWTEIREEQLLASRDMVVRNARKRGHRLSRVSVLADHLHWTIGCNPEESPKEVALSYLNNLAFAHGMKALYCFSYYVGTFGEYDMGAIRRGLCE